MSAATKESREQRNRAVEQLKVKTRVKHFGKQPCIYENKNSHLESVRNLLTPRHLEVPMCFWR